MVSGASSGQPTPARSRLRGIDALKGVLILLVIVWHARYVEIVAGESAASALAGAGGAADLAYRWVTLLAVPAFLVVSLWLYVLRRDGSVECLRRRLLRLGTVFAVWATVQVAVALLVFRDSNIPWSVNDLITGGPPLPFVGESVLYFLPNLVLLICAAEALMQVPAHSRRPVCAGLLVAIAAAYGVLAATGTPVSYISPLSFLAAAPIAVLLYDLGPDAVRRAVPWLALAWFFVAVAEVLAERGSGVSVPEYARVSVWLGAAVLFGAIGLGAGGPRWLERLGQHTLGVFVLHKYVFLVLLAFLPVWTVSVAGLPIRLDKALLVVLTVAVSVVLVTLLKRTPLKAVL